MYRNLEGVHVGFLRQVMGKTSKRQMDRTWRSAEAASVIKETGTKTLRMYIDKCQEKVVEWVELSPIFEVSDRETGYEGGGRRQELWWRQTKAQNQLSATLEQILAAEKAQRWESIWR